MGRETIVLTAAPEDYLVGSEPVEPSGSILHPRDFMKRPLFPCAALAMVCVAAAPAAARGQSPDALLRRVAERAAARMQGVSNYTVELAGLDARVTLYVSRRTPTAELDVQFAGTGQLGSDRTDIAIADDMVLAFQDRRTRSRFRARFTYAGMAEVGGTPVFAVTATLPASRAPVDGILSETLTVYYDTATLLPRKVAWVTGREGGRTVENAVEYEDYRDVQGMQIAFRRRMVIRGLGATLSAAEIAHLQRTADRFRVEAPRYSEPERTQSLQMLEALDGLLNRDEMITELTVTSVQVNQGLPLGLPLRRLRPLPSS